MATTLPETSVTFTVRSGFAPFARMTRFAALRFSCHLLR
jgi:hypothetical protein